MGVVILNDVLAEEGFLGGQFGLCKVLPGVHVLVYVHAFAQQKLSTFTAGLVPACYFEGLRLVGRQQLVKGGQQELGAVDESQLVQGERDILLRVVWDANKIQKKSSFKSNEHILKKDGPYYVVSDI